MKELIPADEIFILLFQKGISYTGILKKNYDADNINHHITQKDDFQFLYTSIKSLKPINVVL